MVPVKSNQNSFLIGLHDMILVTGANGFLGSKVVSTLLSYGFQKIRCLIRDKNKSEKLLRELGDFHRERVEVVMGNLLSREVCEVAAEGVSLVYHLAAGVGKSFPDCFLNSVVTTRNLLDAAIGARTIKRFVNISSIAVYSCEDLSSGDRLDETCMVENEFMERYEAYVFGKAKQDEIVRDYGIKFNLPYVIVRPSVVFGPGKAKITDRIGTDTFGLFLHLGLGNRIPMTYVDNCAEAIVLAGLKRGVGGETFNIVDDDLPRSRDFLKLYKKKVRKFLSIPVPHLLWYLFCASWEKYSKWSNGQLPPVFNRKVYRVYWRDYEYPNEKAKRLLGWYPRIKMDEAIDKFFAYTRSVGSRK
ncbi:MAG: NAD-dependent epimerase/dehydratase family protein [Deltaproteobacteria bacterium]|nr:NAD-dependent epimerase/dehydratase family protein [Deltaproteobacteria bacterium]